MTKQSAAIVPTSGMPTYIRSVDSVLSSGDRQYLRRKLEQKLRKFAPAVERSSVRVEDINGPRGGADKRCRIKVVLRGLPSVVVEELHESLQAAMDGALNRMERAVRRATDRRRTKPLKGHSHALRAPIE
ncbi:MAG TPA: HPF/RaiA family ribosome-associated protein [Woeseiaceae bacterium]|nr:HPF/RaiA family ribosome-associated protein [Woeseiaceae bacterium]